MKQAKTACRRNRSLLACSLAALLALPLLGATEGTAEADVNVRVRGSVKVRTPRVRVRVRTHAPRVRVRHHRTYRTHRARHRLHVSGGVYVGGSIHVGPYAAPPPPPPSYDCDVPAYYYSSPRPLPPPVVVAPHHPDPIGPRFAIGAFAGGVKTEHSEADDVGLLARLRMTRGLALEGEIARTETGDEESRRLGGALIWDLAPRSTWSPHLLGGMGRWDDGNYAEVGAGLTWRIGHKLHLAFDLRSGLHGAEDDAAPVARGTTISDSEDEPTSYTRGRLSALLYF